MREIPEPPPVLRTVLWCIGLLVVVHGCNVMFIQTAQYLALRDDVGFLPLKRPCHHLFHWKAAFYCHVFSSIFSLFAAFTQFLPVRTRFVALLHRGIGKLYAGVILLIAAPSGAILAWYAEGGLVARTGFFILACLWFGTTLAGLLAAHRRQFDSHLAWMTRSYALAFSAVTLREWQYWLNHWLPLSVDLYVITAWLGWVPNLLIAEVWLRRGSRYRARAADRKQSGAVSAS